MDIKRYIDNFPEIAHMKREKQFELLELACDDVKSNTAWPSFSTIELSLRACFIIVLSALSYIAWGFSAWLLGISIVVGLIASTIAITEINERLVHNGLIRVLNRHDV